MAKKRKWTIGQYSKYLKQARKGGLTTEQAKRSYSQMRGKLGRSIFASDIKRHPKEFEEARKDIIGESLLAENLLEELIDDAPENIQTLFDRHYGKEGYDFLAEEGILKVSISTTKTKAKFSVRLN